MTYIEQLEQHLLSLRISEQSYVNDMKHHESAILYHTTAKELGKQMVSNLEQQISTNEKMLADAKEMQSLQNSQN